MLLSLTPPVAGNAWQAPLLTSVTIGKTMEVATNPAPDVGLGTAILAGMGAIALGAVLFVMIGWNTPRVAGNPAPITVGSAMHPAAPHTVHQ